MFAELYYAAPVTAPCESEGEGGGESHHDESNRDAFKFSQEDVDRIIENRLAKERRSKEKAAETLHRQFDDLSRSSELAQAERDSYKQKADALAAELSSSREHERKLSEERLKRAVAKHEAATKQATELAESYKRRYEESLVDAVVTQAAVKHDAFDPKQMKAILAPTIEVSEDGEVTVLFNDERQSVDSVIEQMRGLEGEYGNLFKADMKSGLGANNFSSEMRAPGPGGRLSREAIARMSHEEYRRVRAEHPEWLGLERKRSHY